MDVRSNHSCDYTTSYRHYVFEVGNCFHVGFITVLIKVLLWPASQRICRCMSLHRFQFIPERGGCSMLVVISVEDALVLGERKSKG